MQPRNPGRISVSPSGAFFSIKSRMATAPPAPGMFSTIKLGLLGKKSPHLLANRRAAISCPPPGVKGTRIRTVLPVKYE